MVYWLYVVRKPIARPAQEGTCPRGTTQIWDKRRNKIFSCMSSISCSFCCSRRVQGVLTIGLKSANRIPIKHTQRNDTINDSSEHQAGRSGTPPCFRLLYVDVFTTYSRTLPPIPVHCMAHTVRYAPHRKRRTPPQDSIYFRWVNHNFGNFARAV